MNKQDKEDLKNTLTALEVICYIAAIVYLIFNWNVFTAQAYNAIQADSFVFSGCSDDPGCIGLGEPYNSYREPDGNTGLFQSGDLGSLNFATFEEAWGDAQSQCAAAEDFDSSGLASVVEFPPNGFVPNFTDNAYYWFAINMQGSESCVVAVVYWDGAEITPFPPETAFGNTRIFSINLPSTDPNTVTSSTTVAWDIDYISSEPVPSEICIELDDLTALQTLLPLCVGVVASGFLTYAPETELIDGHQYRWFVNIKTAENEIIDREGPFFFTVVTPPYSPYTPTESGWPFGTTPSGTSSTSTLSELTLECSGAFFSRSVCNLAVLLFIPSPNAMNQLLISLDTVQSKQPFSAFAEFRQAWTTATKNPTTTPTFLNLDLYGEDIEVVSTSTLNSVLGDNGVTLDFLKGLVVIGLWIFLGWFLFTRVKNLF